VRRLRPGPSTSSNLIHILWEIRVYLGRGADGKCRYHHKKLKGTKNDAKMYVRWICSQSHEEPCEGNRLTSGRSRRISCAWLRGGSGPVFGPALFLVQDFDLVRIHP